MSVQDFFVIQNTNRQDDKIRNQVILDQTVNHNLWALKLHKINLLEIKIYIYFISPSQHFIIRTINVSVVPGKR